MSHIQKDISRRGFFKASGALAGIAALGGALTYKPTRAFAEKDKNAADEGTQGEVFGHCRNCMLCGACSFVGTVKDGVVVNIEGDPDRVSNQGSLCPRGRSSIMNLYNPYRIKAPMKRTNPEKGMDVDPGWVEITWDEALDTAAQKINECVEEDPRTLLNIYGFAAYESSHASLGLGQWPTLLGAENTTSSKGQMCAIHYGGMYTMDATPTVNYDGARCEYVVFVGKSGGFENGYAGGDARAFARNVRRGVKYVTVSPICTMEASCGEWVPIEPGRDLSFIYALLNVLLWEIEEGYDAKFVKSRTNAPYLVGKDREYVRDPQSNKPLIWDNSDQKAKAFDDETLSDPALEGSFTVNGVECNPAFVLYKNAVKDFTPEWASEINTIPAEKMREIAHDLVKYSHFGATIEMNGQQVPYRPASVIVGRGSMSQEDGTLTDIYSRTLNMLLGNYAMPGGLLSTFYGSLFPNEDGTVEPFAEAATMTEPPTWPPTTLMFNEYFPHKHTTCTLLTHVICDPEKYGIDYSPKVLVSQAANPVICTADPDVAIEALRRIEFNIYLGCYHMDEMALMSDLLLPEHAALEQTALHLFPGTECTSTVYGDTNYPQSNHCVLIRKGIKPLYNTMDGNDQLMQIFYRMGRIADWNNMVNTIGFAGYAFYNFTPYWPKAGLPMVDPEYMLEPDKLYTVEEVYDRNLKSAFGPDKGLDYLAKVKRMNFDFDLTQDDPELYPALRDQKTRFQLYLMSQKHSGDVLLPALKSFPVDFGELIQFPLDELERRYQPTPYYPQKVRRIDSEPEEFDLYSFTYRQSLFLFRMANMDQDPIRRDFAERYWPDSNAILINTQTAAEKGIAQGDRIVVESPYGKTKGKAYVTERVHPSSIGIGGVRGRKAPTMGKALLDDTNYNDLMCGDFGYFDPLHGGTINTMRVKVYHEE